MEEISSLEKSELSKEGKVKIQTTEDVGQWLIANGKSQYAELFSKNEINGEILLTLTAEELRDDLEVRNLRHRREILAAISQLSGVKDEIDLLPEHGRILDHLSNVRTFHSWVRVGIQLLAFSLISLRLFPQWRDGKTLITSSSIYYSLIGVFAIVYGLVRYILVINWIEESGVKTPKYIPDRLGVSLILLLVLAAASLTLYIITLEGV